MCDLGRPPTELVAKLRRIAQTDTRPERLYPRPVGGRSARLPAAAYEDVGSAGLRMAGQLLCKATLADAGLPDEEEHPAVSVVGVGESIEQLFELALAADESPSRELGPLGVPVILAGKVERGVLAEDRSFQGAEVVSRLEA